MNILQIWQQISRLINGSTATDGQVLVYNATTKRFEPSDFADIDGFAVVDEDDMASDSAVSVPTQQSVKAFVEDSIAEKAVAILHTTEGGGATETIAAVGVVATDVVVVTLHTAGTTPRTVLSAQAGTDEVDVVFSGDPADDHIINVVIIRP